VVGAGAGHEQTGLQLRGEGIPAQGELEALGHGTPARGKDGVCGGERVADARVLIVGGTIHAGKCRAAILAIHDDSELAAIVGLTSVQVELETIGENRPCS
jgi:hypothetical protein